MNASKVIPSIKLQCCSRYLVKIYFFIFLISGICWVFCREEPLLSCSKPTRVSEARPDLGSKQVHRLLFESGAINWAQRFILNICYTKVDFSSLLFITLTAAAAICRGDLCCQSLCHVSIILNADWSCMGKVLYLTERDHGNWRGKNQESLVK